MLFVSILVDLISMTRLLLIIKFVIGIMGWQKKNRLAEQIYVVLSNLFDPILMKVRSFLPNSQFDYSAPALVVGLWIVQRLLCVVAV